MAATAPRETTKVAQDTRYASLYPTPPHKSLADNKRILVQKNVTQVAWDECKYLPSTLLLIMAENKYDALPDAWLETNKTDPATFYDMSPALQRQALGGLDGCYLQRRRWPLLGYRTMQLTNQHIGFIVGCSELGASAMAAFSYFKVSAKRSLETEAESGEILDDVEINEAKFIEQLSRNPGTSMDTHEKIQKMTEKLKLSKQKYKAVKSGPEFYKMMMNESDPVKKAWMQHIVDNNLIDTKQIPKVVVAHYRNLGVYFPGL